MVRMDFGRLHCYYRQPKITQAQFCVLGNLSWPHYPSGWRNQALDPVNRRRNPRAPAGVPAFQAVGFGVPGIIDPAAGVVINLTNVKGWCHIPLGALVSERIGWLLTWKMTPKRWPTQNGSTGQGTICPT
jgi:hypothetical protein